MTLGTPENDLDRLTALPDALVIDILTLLPTKTAVSTSVLSTRYHHLWTHLTHLHLDHRHFPSHSPRFYAIVDRLLTRLTSPFIHTFFLRAPYPCYQFFVPWLRQLCARSVHIIDISFSSSGEDSSDLTFTLPQCVFESQCLVSLNLPTYRLNYELPGAAVRLPNLRLMVFGIRASEDGLVVNVKKLVEYLVTNAPNLEKLTFVVIPFQNPSDDSVKYKLEEALFCIELYSCVLDSSKCVIEFNGLHTKLPVSTEEFFETRCLAELFRGLLTVQDILGPFVL